MRGTAKSDYELLQDQMRQLKRENAALRARNKDLTRKLAARTSSEWYWRKQAKEARG
jgi:phage shock protein A